MKHTEVMALIAVVAVLIGGCLELSRNSLTNAISQAFDPDPSWRLYKEGKVAEAEASYERALTTAHRPEPYCRHLFWAANVYKSDRKYDRAEQLLKEYLAIVKKEPRWEKGSWADSCTASELLAEIYTKQGRFEQAEPLYLYDLHETERRYGPHDYSNMTACAAIKVAEFYTQWRKTEKAEELYKRALSFYDSNVVHDDLARSYAKLLRSLGRGAEADKLEGKSRSRRSSP